MCIFYVSFFNKTGRTVPATLVSTLCGLVAPNATSKSQKGTLAEVTVSTFNLMHTAFTIKLEIQSDFNLIPDRGPVSVPSPASSSYSSSSASFRGSVPEGAEYAVLKLSGQSGGGGGTVDVYVQEKCPSVDNSGRVAAFLGETLVHHRTLDGGEFGMIVAREQFPRGFYLTFANHLEDGGGNTNGGDGTYKLALEAGINPAQFAGGVAFTVAFVGLVYTVAAAAALFVLWERNKDQQQQQEQQAQEQHQQEQEGSSLMEDQIRVFEDNDDAASVPEVRVTFPPASSASAEDGGVTSGRSSPPPPPPQSKQTIGEEFVEGLQRRRQELLPDESGDGAAGTAAAGGSGYADVNELKRELLGDGGCAPPNEEPVGAGALVPYSAPKPSYPPPPPTAPPQAEMDRHDEQHEEEEETSREGLVPPVEGVLNPPPAPALRRLLPLCAFFAVPVVMLAASYAQLVGFDLDSNDGCYRNFLCAHSAWGVPDVSHVVSNAGYFFFGLLFMAGSEFRRQTKPAVGTVDLGLPCQHDFHLLLGLLLCLEGATSACYHLCPSRSNLQLDVLFIYAVFIAVTLKNHLVSMQTTLAEYQNCRLLSLSLLSALALSALGTAVSSPWAALAAFALAAAASVPTSAALYHRGRWAETRVLRWSVELPLEPFRSRPVWASVAANWVLMAGGAVAVAAEGDTTQVPSIIFLVLAFNAAFSCHHCYSRLFSAGGCNPTRRSACLILSILAALLWIPAAAAFLARNYDTAEPPEESRQLNAQCQFLEFYDYHDLWHFFSAVAALITLAAIACADEAFEQVPKEVIKGAFEE